MHGVPMSLHIRRRRAAWFLKWRSDEGVYFCYWCGLRMNSLAVTRDHVVPKSVVRKLPRTSGIQRMAYGSNEVPACRGCNLERGLLNGTIQKLHRLEHVRTIPKVPRERMIQAERRLIGLIGSEFVEWKY